jgi:tetratricopeptide (TPR) repeat protein
LELILDNASLAQQVLRQIQRGHREAAVSGVATLVRSEAALGDLWLHLAHGALSIGELTLADSAARLFLAVDKSNEQRVLQYAGVLAEAGRFEKALKTIRPRLKQNPSDVSLNHLIGTVYQQLGEPAQAAKHLRTALKGARLSGVTSLTLAAHHTFKDGDTLLDRLLVLQDDFARTDNFNRVQYQYALGKALLDLRQHGKAFEAFAQGASLSPESSQYNAEAESRRVEAVIRANTAAALAAVSSPEKSVNRALFVIGLPRSGTTLLQRILSAHQKVSGGGEFSGMAVASMDWRRRSHDNLEFLGRQQDGGAAALAEMAQIYTHLADERFGSNGLIVDKSISNTYHAGLIAKVFPKAPILVTERNIEDVAWSCFRTCFNRGLNWSWSLDNIASHFRAEKNLLNHWKSVLEDRLIVVKYEELVGGSEQVLPQLFERCGLEFSQNIYRFHQKKTPVTTSSVVQVNQPLNKRAVGSAQHVAEQMKPFTDAYSA